MPSNRLSSLPATPDFADDPRRRCKDADTELFFPDTHNAVTDAPAKAICRPCPLKLPCLLFALRTKQWGIWGETNSTERIPKRRRTLPEPPPLADQPWGWRTNGLETTDLPRLFGAAQDHLDGKGMQQEMADRWQVGKTAMSNAVLILRHAPDLRDKVIDGWLPIGHALRYARQVRDSGVAA